MKTYIVIIWTREDRGSIPPRQASEPISREEADAAVSYWVERGYTAMVAEAL